MINTEIAKSVIKGCCAKYVAAENDKMRAAKVMATQAGLKLVKRRNLIDCIRLAENEQSRLIKKIIAYSAML